MHSISIENVILNVASLFYRLGLWHHGADTAMQKGIKIFYWFFYSLLPVSLFAGAISTSTSDEAIFSVEIGIASSIALVKLWFLFCKKHQILELLHSICIYTVKDRENFTLVKDTLTFFSRFTTVLFSITSGAAFYSAIIVPISESERRLFFNIAFPVDWKNNEMAFWIAALYLVVAVAFSVLSILFTSFIWYVKLNCALRYEVLGNEMKTMGEIRTTDGNGFKRNTSNAETQKLFFNDLVAAIDSHHHIVQLTKALESVLSKLFFTLIVPSGLCICLSTYCLGFNLGENLVERLFHLVSLFYYLCEMFMITYFGHQTMHFSDRLSYCLFESNWIEQPHSIKKLIFIFGEQLKQPQVIVVGYLYPLTLNTFNKILHSAYTMFNILQNLK